MKQIFVREIIFCSYIEGLLVFHLMERTAVPLQFSNNIFAADTIKQSDDCLGALKLALDSSSAAAEQIL